MYDLFYILTYIVLGIIVLAITIQYIFFTFPVISLIAVGIFVYKIYKFFKNNWIKEIENYKKLLF